MKITPTTLSINQLLGSGNEQFIIPAYQRRYSWGEKQWSDLFNDIKLLSQQDSHLLGTILCLTSNYAVGINQLELVDGQQRTTTLTLLLKALSDKFTKLKQDELHKEIDSLLYCKGLDRVLKRKVILGDLDNPDYEKLMKNEDLDSIKNQKFIEGYNFFMRKLNELDLTELLEYHYKLVSNTYTIRLDVGNAKDAYKLFETINNRGLSLSPTDIIKNFLLGHSSLIDDNTLEKVKGYWTELIINLDGIKTDDFFRQYLSSQLKRKITGSTIIDEFKKYYFESVIEAEGLNEFSQYKQPRSVETDEDELEETHVDVESESTTINGENHKISIINFAKRLRDASKTYGQIRNELFSNVKVNKHLNNLTKIKSFPSYIFLLDLFQRDVEDAKKIDILILIETFMLRRHVCEYRTGELDSIFASLVSVENENIVENIKEKLLKHFPSDNEFKDKFYRYSFKGNENRAKYVLETFEYDLIKDQGEYILTSGGELHLEHIIPQKITTKKSKEFGDWEMYLGAYAKEQHMKYVNRIGNFTLLAKTLNIVASNNPFKSKVKEYQKSNIQLTKLLSKLDEFKIQQVKDRSTEFATKAVQLWSF
ncbi:DUF262 domain-containing HNH endonuclease family protein [Peribacillus frigoritolerans]|uniref:DUF262 domain-containing protein n=1 Tax=Peribacillus frigoritolerans TaxID=450367 RepID=UPI0039A3F1CD